MKIDIRQRKLRSSNFVNIFPEFCCYISILCCMLSSNLHCNNILTAAREIWNFVSHLLHPIIISHLARIYEKFYIGYKFHTKYYDTKNIIQIVMVCKSYQKCPWTKLYRFSTKNCYEKHQEWLFKFLSKSFLQNLSCRLAHRRNFHFINF